MFNPWRRPLITIAGEDTLTCGYEAAQLGCKQSRDESGTAKRLNPVKR